jgi:hypothetical protein
VDGHWRGFLDRIVWCIEERIHKATPPKKRGSEKKRMAPQINDEAAAFTIESRHPPQGA